MAYQIILCRLKKQKQNQENHEMNKFEFDCKCWRTTNYETVWRPHLTSFKQAGSQNIPISFPLDHFLCLMGTIKLTHYLDSYWRGKKNGIAFKNICGEY